MILVDFSSVLHRKIFTGVSNTRPNKINGKFITSEFIDYTMYLVLEELFSISREFNRTYGEMIICLDNKSPEGYWRKDVLSTYKAHRAKFRDESEIEFSEVWPKLNELTDVIIKTLPFKSLEVHRAEADDLILVVADMFKDGKTLDKRVLIHSPDKDLIQAQIGSDLIDQYSSLTNKFIKPDTKSETIDSWILEHVCLGDAGDGVPRIVDGTEFSDAFTKFLLNSNIPENIATCPLSFRTSLEIPTDKKIQLVNTFDVYKYNRAGEQQEKDVYKNIRFGKSTLMKAIEKHGSLDNFLDSNPLYRTHYDRNRTLVLTEGIPDYIRLGTEEAYYNAKAEFDEEAFTEYLKEHNLMKILEELPLEVTSKRKEISADFW